MDNILIVKVSKIEISFNFDKRVQLFNEVKQYPYGKSVGRALK